MRNSRNSGMRYGLCLPFWLAAALMGKAAVFSENFSTDPFPNRWSLFGDASLFRWNATNQNLEVTWESSRTNSYWHRALGTVLCKSDDFSLAFDLRLHDIAIGVDPNKPYTFQLAIGFLNFQSATHQNFFRGTGINPTFGPKNLVEFNYFPDSGFGATVAPTVVSTNNRIRFSDNHPLELTAGDLFRVAMSYTASNQLLRTVMLRNGAPFGMPPGNTIQDLSLAGFPDFCVDRFAVMSYSDAGQSPPQYAGSILAHGVVDNIAWTVPAPPFSNISGNFSNNTWTVTFIGRSNWLYSLEQTVNFQSWTTVISNVSTHLGPITLQDTNGTFGPAGFYRIGASRP